jgi:hypothetical protein
VLKITETSPACFIGEAAKKSYLTSEAAMMGQCIERQSDSLVQLRQYRVNMEFVRYCMEYYEFETFGEFEVEI